MLSKTATDLLETVASSSGRGQISGLFSIKRLTVMRLYTEYIIYPLKKMGVTAYKDVNSILPKNLYE